MLIPYSGEEPISAKIPARLPIICVIFAAAFVVAFVLSIMYAQHYYKMSEQSKEDLENYKLVNLEAENLRESETSRLLYENEEFKASIEAMNSLYEEKLDQLEKSHAIEFDRYEQTFKNIESKLNSIEELRNELAELHNKTSEIVPSAVEIQKISTMDEVDFTSGTTLVGVSANLLVSASTLAEDLPAFNENIQTLKDFINDTPSIWPIVGKVTEEMGERTNPITGEGTEYHSGMDIRAVVGDPVVATADGTVSFSGENGGYGNFIIIDHKYGVQTCYGHNSKLLVNVGDKVKKGDTIAQAGNTGRSTGPHLHYEVRVKGEKVNPRNFLKEEESV